MTPQPLKAANMAIISLGSEMKEEMCKTLDIVLLEDLLANL